MPEMEGGLLEEVTERTGVIMAHAAVLELFLLNKNEKL